MTLPTRRTFLAQGAGMSVLGLLPRGLRAAFAPDDNGGTEITGTLSVDADAPGFDVPKNFTGLSYESAQLANPAFFAGDDKQLIALFRELTPDGVLRLGGGSSEFTTFAETSPAGPPPFATFGPDTSKTVKAGTVTSALALHHLRDFLDATGWSCLYGLNLGRGSQDNAVMEAAAAYSILGPRLLALQIGNEPDSFRNRYRPASYGPEDFVREWMEFHDAIVARVPKARFAGPDISNKLSFLTAFAEAARKLPDVILLDAHYYAMGPAGNPEATLDNLLSANPKLTTLKWRDVPIIENAMKTAHLPFRVSEMNSCWNGGMPGVSDVFASALWCADAMLHFASLGFAGVNLHGGGNGIYSPIVGSPDAGFERRPEFFGILFGQSFAGTRLLRSNFTCSSDRVTAYAGRSGHSAGRPNQVALINKTETAATIHLTAELAGGRPWQITALTAPSLQAKDGVHLARASDIADSTVQVPAHTAWLLRR